jgi:hypothetical protein
MNHICELLHMKEAQSLADPDRVIIPRATIRANYTYTIHISREGHLSSLFFLFLSFDRLYTRSFGDCVTLIVVKKIVMYSFMYIKRALLYKSMVQTL